MSIAQLTDGQTYTVYKITKEVLLDRLKLTEEEKKKVKLISYSYNDDTLTIEFTEPIKA